MIGVLQRINQYRGRSPHAYVGGWDRQAFIGTLPDEPFGLQPVLEPDNPYDANAIGLWVTRGAGGGSQRCRVGHISRDLSAELAARMRAGRELHITGIKERAYVRRQPIVAIRIAITTGTRRRTGRPSW